jgi:hypothetical protein
MSDPMLPWTILGWGVLSVVALFLLAALFRAGRMIVVRLLFWNAHIRTRRIPLAVGQVWMQDFDPSNRIYVTDEYPTRFGLSTSPIRFSGMSWGETPEEWKKRVANRRLVLLRTDGDA